MLPCHYSRSLWRHFGGQHCLSLHHPAGCQNCFLPLSVALHSKAPKAQPPSSCSAFGRTPKFFTDRRGNRAPALKGLHFDRQRKRGGKLEGKSGRRNAACTVYKDKFGSNYLLALMLNFTFRDFIFNHCTKRQLFESSCLRGCRTG